MKRLSCFAVLVVFCLSIFAISVNPSMDGRAVVADAGVFPPGGYYGRAPGYLPGDTVVVTNHNNGFSIDVLILGTYDAYEGIAILLSPEAADKLQIVKGKDVYVKVQKKQPISYEEAVATSKNKKVNQVVDTDKDSSVLPGETEQLVNNVIASKNNSENTQEEVLPVEELETLENEAEITEPVITEVNETENSEPEEISEVAEIPQEEIEESSSEIAEDDFIEPVVVAEEETLTTEEETSEVADLEELAEPEDYVESESIDSPVFEVAEEIPVVEEEPVMEEVAEELPEEKEEEVVLDDIQNEDFDESDFIETPVESEIAEITEEEILPEEEAFVEEVPEEIAELEEITEEDFADEEYIVLDDISEEEIAEEIVPVEEELAELESVEEELAEVPELECEETEVALEEVSPAEELEEVLVPEEEVAEITPEEEIIVPEVLETESMEEEPELAVLDDYVEEPLKSVVESPKDIFSMIVGEELEDDIIEDVVLEEAEPRLPELDDSYSEENDVADLEIKLDEPERNLSEFVSESEPVAVVKNETSTNSVVSSNVDGYTNTVADFKDLPKVKNAKSSTYYIQIATVNKEENVAKMIDLHGKKYPVYVIKNPAKSSYQILVGPLNDDEYALVLARFKQTYKDAFLRVAK